MPERWENAFNEFAEWLRARGTKVAAKTLAYLDTDRVSVHKVYYGNSEAFHYEMSANSIAIAVPAYVRDQFFLFKKEKEAKS